MATVSYDYPVAPPTPRRPSSSRRGLVIGIGILAVALVAAAAGLAWIAVSYSSAPAAEPTPAPTAFRNADELVDYLNAHGLPCGPVEHVSSPTNAQSLIDCGKTIVVAVYGSHADAVGQFDEMAATLKGVSAVHMAIGSNWTVSSDAAAYAQAVARLLNAQYKTT